MKYGAIALALAASVLSLIELIKKLREGRDHVLGMEVV